MQVLGKRSKILLITVAIVMLIAVGVSFATWDSSAVKATSGDLSTYANAKVGDVITFGEYYQDINLKDETTGEYKKTPIEWIVVDKDERTGQLTLMSKYILACGSYFGNYYYKSNGGATHYDGDLTDNVAHNQAYVESTVRAYLNNLERHDLGGDSYVDNVYKPSINVSSKSSGLLVNVGFSNKEHFSDLYTRPITEEPYKNRPMARGFYDEAFSEEEKSLIAPKSIPGYTGFRWPDENNDISYMSYVEGSIDKVWIPSLTELGGGNDNQANSSDSSDSTVFEYFKNPTKYHNAYSNKINISIDDARRAEKTTLITNDNKAGNFAIPVYKKGSTIINDDIDTLKNSSNYYWTRTPLSHWVYSVRLVRDTGDFGSDRTYGTHVGVRPCVLLKY